MNGPYKTKSIWVITASHQKAIRLANWIWDDPIRSLDRKHQKYLLFHQASAVSE